MKNRIGSLLLVVLVAGGVWYALLKPGAPSLPVSETPSNYTNEEYGFSAFLDESFGVDERYAYQLNPTTVIPGVKFLVPSSLTSGTNLSSDSGVSVEELPGEGACTADRFLDGTHNPYGDGRYSVASTENAGAGNRYEEIVYALWGSSPCVAIRYFLHYTVVENYEPGTVTSFDRALVLSQFDALRDSIELVP